MYQNGKTEKAGNTELIRGAKNSLFLDVSANIDNAEPIEIMIYVEEWTFNNINLSITGVVLVVLVSIYIAL